jgi:hypothetical protein
MTNPDEAEINAAFKPAQTIEERRVRLKSAREMVSAICQNPRQWRMCIPVQPDDTDIVLSAALTDAKASLSELEQLRAKWNAIPWDALSTALKYSLVEECYATPGAHIDVEIAEAWLAAHAPRSEAAE